MAENSNCVELRVLGPEGRPFIELEEKYHQLFSEHGAYFISPMLFSSPKSTTVAIAIGIGVLTGSGTHLVNKLIDEIFIIKETQQKTEIHITIQKGDNHYQIEGKDKDEVLKNLKAFKDAREK